jgi:hypothetical protein
VDAISFYVVVLIDYDISRSQVPGLQTQDRGPPENQISRARHRQRRSFHSAAASNHHHTILHPPIQIPLTKHFAPASPAALSTKTVLLSLGLLALRRDVD